MLKKCVGWACVFVFGAAMICTTVGCGGDSKPTTPATPATTPPEKPAEPAK